MYIRSIQNILLMKPRQYNNQMLDIFGGKLLTEVYLQQFDLWVDGCPSFHDEETTSIQKIVNVSDNSCNNLSGFLNIF